MSKSQKLEEQDLGTLCFSVAFGMQCGGAWHHECVHKPLPSGSPHVALLESFSFVSTNGHAQVC